MGANLKDLRRKINSITGTKKQLERGKRLTELLKQDQYVPLDVADQVISLFAATQGLMDEIPVEKVKSYEESLYKYIKTKYKKLRDELEDKKEISDKLSEELKNAIVEFNGKGIY